MKERSTQSLFSLVVSTPARADEVDQPTGAGIAVVTSVIRILALTRDATARDLLMEIALERGYGLCCAIDGAEAIRILGTEPPALMVVDIDTPDGRALIRALRANERWRGIPLLALTATNNPMVTVAVDAPVFFKPDLDGLLEAITGRFEPEGWDTPEIAHWPRRPPSA